MKKVFFALLPLLLLTACYPIIQKTRPKLHVIVLNEDAQEIENAKVVLMTNIREGKSVTIYETQYTVDGRTNFQKNSELYLKLLDFNRQYSWSVCVSKQGYKKQYQPILNENMLTFKLKKIDEIQSTSQECHENLRSRNINH